MNTFKSKLAAVALAGAVTLGIAVPSFGALRKVDQKVYGMDCAPCAYGVEKGLKKLEGVKEVKVSLNKGNAVVELKAENEVSVQQIREVVRNGGFTPKEASVELAGKISHAGGTPHVLTEDGTRYTLAADDKADDKAKETWEKVRQATDGAEVVVKGVVPEKEPTQVKVKEFFAS